MSVLDQVPNKPVRHILSLSGGKDSSALAIYMKNRVPDMEYVFSDTGKELEETYDYLDRLEAYLGKEIVTLKHESANGTGDPFEDLLKIKRNYLPSPQMRWCTQELKIRPFEKYVGDDPVINYVGIRADENRKGYISSKPNITPCYPFIEDGLGKADVADILNNSGLGFPDYYQWRSRSGCFFCFFQQRIEWVGLLERHPDLFEKAKRYEKHDEQTGRSYTWVDRESLIELSRPERVAEIKEEHERRVLELGVSAKNKPLADILLDDDDGPQPCFICHL